MQSHLTKFILIITVSIKLIPHDCFTPIGNLFTFITAGQFPINIKL